MMARGYDQIRCPQQQRQQLLSLGHSGPHVEVTAAAANRFIGFFSFAHHRVASTRVAMKCCPKVGCSISLSNLFFHWHCAVRCCGAVHWKHFRFVRVQMLRQSGTVDEDQRIGCAGKSFEKDITINLQFLLQTIVSYVERYTILTFMLLMKWGSYIEMTPKSFWYKSGFNYL